MRLIEHHAHKRRFDTVGTRSRFLAVRQRVVALHRLEDCVARAFAGEVLDAQVIREQIRDQDLNRSSLEMASSRKETRKFAGSPGRLAQAANCTANASGSLAG